MRMIRPLHPTAQHQQTLRLELRGQHGRRWTSSRCHRTGRQQSPSARCIALDGSNEPNEGLCDLVRLRETKE
eukprot:1281478-Pleurochrysis_carterae.AAC.1